jgi:hypothetical protein
MSGKELPELNEAELETTERIMAAIAEAENHIRRAKRNLRERVQLAIADHRDRVILAAQPQKSTRIKTPVDYDKLIAIAQKQPLTYEIIKKETGLNDSGVAEVITTLSLRCALWDPAKGIYELLR